MPSFIKIGGHDFEIWPNKKQGDIHSSLLGSSYFSGGTFFWIWSQFEICGNYGNSLTLLFTKIRESSSLLIIIDLNKELISRNIFWWENFSQCGNYGNLPPLQKIFVKSIYSIQWWTKVRLVALFYTLKVPFWG